MVKKTEKQLLVGLDIGTSKVVAIVGEITENGVINIIGLGHHRSHGLKKGVVVNIESTVYSIQKAIEEAELMAGCRVHSVFTGIAGSHIRSINSNGIIAIRDKEVTSQDIDRVIDAARTMALPADQKILHILPQEFIIDSQEGIKDPIGMCGVRLEAKVHMVTGAVSAAQNIIKCVRRCNLEVEDIILEQLASSYSILTEDEKELGVCIVDIGGGTTDIAVFTNGSICHTAVIPIAGDQVTNDIAVALRTPTQHAEELKILHGSAIAASVDVDDMIDVAAVGDRKSRQISKKLLAEVIEPRYEELFYLIKEELQRSGFEQLIASGIVFTGGSSKMRDAIDLAEDIFKIPVRLGAPQFVHGMIDVVNNPIYATGVGLLLYGHHNQCTKNTELLSRSNFKNVWQLMRNWFVGNF